MDELEKKFNAAMYDLYHKPAEEYGTYFTRFKQSLDKHGGLETARRLLGKSGGWREGFASLFKLGGFFAIDRYSVESLVLKEPWRKLFTEVELKAASQRLAHFKEDPKA